MKWSITLFGRNVLVSTFNGLRSFPDDGRVKFKFALENEFENSKPELIKTLQEVMKQRHGSSAIVVKCKNNIEEHFSKLSKHNKAIKVEKFLDNNGVKEAAHMDGAIVIDFDTSEIKYLAVIVDGESSIPGDMSRGARFNSIKNFTYNIASDKIPIVSIVFSEDGGYDIFEGKNLLKENK